MDLLGDYAFLIASGVQILAYLALAIAALTRLGHRWAALALAGAVVSLVPIGWYSVAELLLRFSENGADSAFELFYAPAAQLLMQALRTIGLLLVVAAVVVGRGPRKEAAPVEGPTGTTFRQLPSNIDWK